MFMLDGRTLPDPRHTVQSHQHAGKRPYNHTSDEAKHRYQALMEICSKSPVSRTS